MEFKGTQGDWRVIDGWKLDENGNAIEKKGSVFPSVVIFGSDDNYKKTMGRSGLVINTSHNQSVSSIMANAQLIAAAPNLLSALQVFVNFPKEDLDGWIDEGKPVTMTVQSCDMYEALKAINKALGL